MQTVSPNFLASLVTNYRLAARVDAHLGVTLLLGNVPYSAGSVTADRGNKISRSLSLTISDIALMPRAAGDALAVYGNTIRAYRGVRFTDGTEEVVPVGVYRIEDPQGDRDLGPITLTGKSLECAVSDEPFLAPFSTSLYGSCSLAIEALIVGALPDAIVTNEATEDPPPATVTWDDQDDRWDAVESLASAMGAECACGPDGTFYIRDLPDLATATPVWDVLAGDGGALVSATTGMDRTKFKNGWLVTGGNGADNAPPVSSLVVDDDPLSPTRWGGPMGHAQGRVQSSLLTTIGQCAVLAESKLRDSLGVTSSISLKSVPNSALEPGDCIRVRYADGYAELHIVQSITMPLTASGEFTLTTYSREDTS